MCNIQKYYLHMNNETSLHATTYYSCSFYVWCTLGNNLLVPFTNWQTISSRWHTTRQWPTLYCALRALNLHDWAFNGDKYWQYPIPFIFNLPSDGTNKSSLYINCTKIWSSVWMETLRSSPFSLKYVHCRNLATPISHTEDSSNYTTFSGYIYCNWRQVPYVYKILINKIKT